MKKNLYLLVLPIITLLLEALPFGAVCNFANPEGEPFRQTFPYFSLVPFGYANFSPLLTGVFTAFIAGILVKYFLFGGKRTLVIAEFFTWICFALSLCPLFYGLRFFSVTGALISFTILIQAILLHITTIKKEH